MGGPGRDWGGYISTGHEGFVDRVKHPVVNKKCSYNFGGDSGEKNREELSPKLGKIGERGSPKVDKGNQWEIRGRLWKKNPPRDTGYLRPF